VSQAAGNGNGWLALFRFWPDVEPRALEAAKSDWRAAKPWVSLEGTFSLSLQVGGENVAEAASIALAEAARLAGLRREPVDGPRPSFHARDPLLPPPATFAEVPDTIGIQLVRAMDGWNAFAIPGQEAWLAFCMAFLRRRLYMRVAYEDAWRDREATELAALVVGTHRAEDVEGTTFTYQVPCIAVPGWLDEEQAGDDGLASLEETESSLLANALHYGALVRLRPRSRTAGAESNEPRTD
jgi:hypothetical protein